MNILSTIGNTPIAELKFMNPRPSRVRILVKLEGHNPGGSVKDRPALYMVEEAEKLGKLKPRQVILEATSGNTGIALAMIGAAKGFRVKLVLPECVSQERIQTLKAYGADIDLTPKDQGTDGAIRRAWELFEGAPDLYFMPDQFANHANIHAHYETTGPEIFKQTSGEVDVFVAGMGTTGTIMGVGEYLHEKKPSVRIVAVEPEKGHAIQGLKNMEESMVPAIFDEKKLDGCIRVNDETAFAYSRDLAVREGIFAGMSSGAAVYGALKIAEEMDSGTIVAVLPDRGDRYLSTTLFRSVCGKCAP